MRAAVIDIGSNTAKLSVYEHDGASVLTPISERGEALGLLRQLGADGSLSPPTTHAPLSLLKSFLREAGELEADRVEVIATSALRDAANRDVLIERARRELGIHIRVLD